VGSNDVWLARIDALGNTVWSRQLGTSLPDDVFGLVPDGRGGIFLGGSTSGDLGAASAGSDDAWVARYDSSGTLMWICQLGTEDPEAAFAAAPDGLGGVYLTGSTAGDLGAPNSGNVDAWLAHIDSAGIQQWIVQLGTSAQDAARVSAADGSGGVLIGGETLGGLGAPNLGFSDVWMARFDSQGNRLWLLQTGTADQEVLDDARADGMGGFLLSGHSDGSFAGQHIGDWDAWLAHYDGSCGAISSYCVASTTSIPGCQAAIGGAGSPSMNAPSGFTISSGQVPGGNVGLCFFGNSGSASIPFGTLGGQICVKPPLYRSAAKSSGGSHGACDGNFVFTLQDLIAITPIVAAGAEIHAEIWGRDSANPDGSMLSNALRFTVCP
jgi:hypothetical protein